MSSRRPGPVVPAMLLLPMFLAVACSGSPDDPEARIRTLLDEMTAALEEGRVEDFMAPIAEDFQAGARGLDRRALGLLVRRERLARSEIRVRRTLTEVELAGAQRARAQFRALATGGSGWLPDEGRLWRVETGWRLDDGDWMMISAEWTPVLGNP